MSKCDFKGRQKSETLRRLS